MNELFSNWVLTYLVHSTVLVAVLWAVDRAAWLRDPQLRERLWRAALVVPVLSAGLQVMLPGVALPTPVALEAAGRGAEAPLLPAEAGLVAASNRDAKASLPQASLPQVESAALPAEGSRDAKASLPQAALPQVESAALPAEGSRDAKASLPQASLPHAEAPLLPELDAAWLLMVWFAVAGWLLLRVAASVVGGRRLLRDRRLVRDGAAYDALASLARSAGDVRASLTVSSRVSGPMTLPGGEVCVPARALSLPSDELRGMLAHELAHVVRRDAELRLVVTLACALLCVQPLNFLVRRRLDVIAELNADDYARELLGEGRSLAACLVRVATWLEPVRAPAFAAAMAESDVGLLARVRRLASAMPEARGWRGRGAIAVLVVLATFAAPSVVLTAASDRPSRTSVSVQEDGTSLSVRSTSDDLAVSMRANGEMRFSATEDGIEYLEPGKQVTIRARDRRVDGEWHELRVQADGDGKLTYEYEVDDEPVPFATEGRAWLAGIIPQLLRATGLQAEERVARIHAQGGVDAVLAEIERISGDYVARIYFGELAELDDVTAAQRVRIYEIAGKSIGSDFELRQTLETFPLDDGSTVAEAGALLTAAEEIGSDFELAQVLMAIAPKLPADERVTRAYAKAAAGIGSDFELSRTLQTALDAPWAKGAALTQIIEVGTEVGSDFELSQFLQRVFRSGKLDEAGAKRTLELAGAEIGSDHELLQTLRTAAPLVKQHPSLRATYERIAEDLGEHEYAQAMRAL